MTRWNFSSTGNEVVETFKDRVREKIIVITGPGVGGIGAETALSLAAGGPSHLILAGRTESKITPVLNTIKSTYPSVSVAFVALDLASQASVRSAAATINSLVDRVDILINNGAVMICPYSKSEDGVEMQFATNYVGHFLLTNLLVERLLNAERPRVVNVSSSAHSMGRIRWDDVNFEVRERLVVDKKGGANEKKDGRTYDEWESYGQSKSANILFSHALATRLRKHGGFSFSLHPGSISSGLQVHMDKALLEGGVARAAAAEKALGREWQMPAPKTLQQGCSTTLVAALDPSIEEENGAYLEDGDIALHQPPEYLSLPENEVRLWKLSEELVGEMFDW